MVTEWLCISFLHNGDPQSQRWKAEWLRKWLVASSDYHGEKTTPTIMLSSDNRPLVGHRTQTKTTLSLSFWLPYFLCLYASLDFCLSAFPSILSLSLPCTAYITLRTQDRLIRETLYKGSSQRGIWLDKTLEIKSHHFVGLSGKLYPDIWSCIFSPNRSCVSLLVAPAGMESSTQERSELLDKLR